ncbi:DUF3618 domain-containing protein [Rubellimicrobium sp. CFH 75288]|uniref:DUF3618 domain-containing protein n=1 Tax=Rubellimicrobium sp. CFH 75288 TaxID=2697034 RepID=UPI00141350E2|nr:DUF3618 domain-containing protein [Rubellimicrobium sp. CFH 75288]NAZ38123.1 DUF3618 domain-containing protein [Rubellimicrobium sp. CFH 75288]
MTTTSTDPRDIEAELAKDRAQLASTLDALSDRMSVDNLAQQALGVIRSSAGTATVSVDRLVRGNPIGMALIGAGVAWLFLGPKLRSRTEQAHHAAGPIHDDWQPEGEDRGWAREVQSLRRKAMDALHSLEDEAKRYTGSARDFAAERAAVISGFAADLRSRLASGLDNLPDEARERIMAARERAYGAMLEAERAGRQVLRDPGRALEEHPFVAGAVALALGAALGAVLPRTEMEDRTFGRERDRLLDEAARMLKAEKDRALQLASSLGEEIKAAATETVEAVAETAKDKAQDAVHRVQERADDEMRRIQGGQQGSSGSGPIVG